MLLIRILDSYFGMDQTFSMVRGYHCSDLKTETGEVFLERIMLRLKCCDSAVVCKLFVTSAQEVEGCEWYARLCELQVQQVGS